MHTKRLKLAGYVTIGLGVLDSLVSRGGALLGIFADFPGFFDSIAALVAREMPAMDWDIAVIVIGITLLVISWAGSAMRRHKAKGGASASLGIGANISGSKSASAAVVSRVGTRPNPRNRLVHKNTEIELHKLISAESMRIDYHIFENCSIVGPAVLLPKQNVRIEGNSKFYGAADLASYMLEVDESRQTIPGGIDIAECLFIDCSFKRILIAGTKTGIDSFLRAFSGAE